MAKHFGHRIGASRMESCPFVLRRFVDFAEHFRARGLEKLGLGSMSTKGLEYPEYTQPRHIPRQNRLVPRDWHETLGREIIDFVRLHRMYRVVERRLIS